MEAWCSKTLSTFSVEKKQQSMQGDKNNSIAKICKTTEHIQWHGRKKLSCGHVIINATSNELILSSLVVGDRHYSTYLSQIIYV